MKDETVRFVSILPELFGDDLDRKTLWERIGNGLKSAIAKSGGDFEVFINNTLEYIRAEHGKVAANEHIEMFINMALTRPKEWKEQFMRTIEKKIFMILVKARRDGTRVSPYARRKGNETHRHRKNTLHIRGVVPPHPHDGRFRKRVDYQPRICASRRHNEIDTGYLR